MPVEINMQIAHMGGNAWFIWGMPSIFYKESYRWYNMKNNGEILKYFNIALRKLIKKSNGKYINLCTANQTQAELYPILLKNKFRHIVTFYSSHNSKLETLSLWLKIQENKPDNVNINKESFFGYNCTISVNKIFDMRFTLLSSKLIPNDFTQISKTPISYRILGTNGWDKILDKGEREKLGLKF